MGGKETDKNTKLNRNSASFKPKFFKPKSECTNTKLHEQDYTMGARNVNNTGENGNKTSENTMKCDPSGRGILPPPLLMGVRMPESLGMMQFPGLMGQPPMDFSQILPFTPMKPPPLLFSQPDQIDISKGVIESFTTSEPKKLKMIVYSADQFLKMKEMFKEAPAGMNPIDLPTKLNQKGRKSSSDNDNMKFFRTKERKFSNFRSNEKRFTKGARKTTN